MRDLAIGGLRGRMGGETLSFQRRRGGFGARGRVFGIGDGMGLVLNVCMKRHTDTGICMAWLSIAQRDKIALLTFSRKLVLNRAR